MFSRQMFIFDQDLIGTPMPRTITLFAILLIAASCKSQSIEISLPTGDAKIVTFYEGSDTVPDLLIIDGQNHFGKVNYDDSDSLTDLAWRGEDGTKANAECIQKRPKKFRKDEFECALYEIFRSTSDLIPEGSTFLPPESF